LLRAFETSYAAAFTRTPPTTRVEIINVRVSASLGIEAVAPVAQPARAAMPLIKGRRKVYFPEFAGFRSTQVFDRYGLNPGQALHGPAIVEERESTLLVGPGGRLEVSLGGNITVTIG
jgi:N-methylhydantoinase A